MCCCLVRFISMCLCNVFAMCSAMSYVFLLMLVNGVFMCGVQNVFACFVCDLLHGAVSVSLFLNLLCVCLNVNVCALCLWFIVWCSMVCDFDGLCLCVWLVFFVCGLCKSVCVCCV